MKYQKHSSSFINSQESGLVMEAIEATQFNDLNNENMGIPIPDSKNTQRSQQRRKKEPRNVLDMILCSQVSMIFMN